MGADYTFYMKTIETHACAFFKVIIFSISSVGTYFSYLFTLLSLHLEEEKMKLDNSRTSIEMDRKLNYPTDLTSV